MLFSLMTHRWDFTLNEVWVNAGLCSVTSAPARAPAGKSNFGKFWATSLLPADGRPNACMEKSLDAKSRNVAELLRILL